MSLHYPFHEAIVVIIKKLSPTEMPLIACILQLTKIPQGHDEIIGAWKERESYWRERGACMATFDELLFDIEEQKKVAEAEAERKWKAELAEIIADARSDCN
jgi:hypothetical protein